jgi:hypothetical protein
VVQVYSAPVDEEGVEADDDGDDIVGSDETEDVDGSGLKIEDVNVGDSLLCLRDEEDMTEGNTYVVIDLSEEFSEVMVTDDAENESWCDVSLFKKVDPVVGHFAPAESVVEPAPEPEDDVVTEAAPGTPELMFTAKGGRSYLASEVRNLLSEHGQRGMSRLTGVPRTTIQDWVKAINANA